MTNDQSKSVVYHCDGSSLTELSVTGLPTSGMVAITTTPDGVDAFTVTSGSVYEFDTSSLITTCNHDVSTPVKDISYFDTNDTDYLLIGGKEGYGEIPISSDGTIGSYQNPGSNSNSTITEDAKSQYNSNLDNYCVQKIWGISYPVPNGNDYVLYADVIDPSYGGLWAYYSDTRQTWNRE